ncbi:hypothetical protein MSAN_00306700 [Mycena sanguinolenta]|uniref:Uncharacterized protein n=1 Tax=Mycena sanguinolenta TaxID=230812 RepID=A0A8H6Z809_9AGAR|nr:hypothetical protein MSAN_00306700 [Mycena sanguinolenta]
MFRGPRQSRRAKIIEISGGTDGSSGGAGEGPRVKVLYARTITTINKSYSTAPAVPSNNLFHRLPSGATILDSLTINQYHEILRWEFRAFRCMSISPSVTLHLGCVFSCPSEDTVDDIVEIVWLPYPELSSHPSWGGIGNGQTFGQLMADGWTCLKSNDIVGTKFWVHGFSTLDYKFWLSQANHIFTTLQISSNFHDYVVVYEIHFQLSVSTTEGDIPPGFLFLCPSRHFQTRESSFKWPDCPAYWSLDPSGAERLTSEDAISLGFPSFQLFTEIKGYSWDASVYAGIHQFHQAKGFDPGSQDVARHLGHKLYQVSDLFAHMDNEYSKHGDDTNQWFMNEEFDDEPGTTPMPVNHDSVPASTNQDMEQVPVPRTFEEITSVSTDLPQMDWDTSAAGSSDGCGYDIQPNLYSSTPDFSPSDLNFNTQYNSGNDLSWHDSSSLVFNDAALSASSLNYQPPMLPDAVHYFSAPPLPTSLSAPSLFPIAPVVNSQVADFPSRKRKTRDKTDLMDMVQGTRAQKAPKRF